ncbi:Hypothetical predicted protein [Cloeon dipterum]|uniref:Uncharacterized protein n=1 Tax=Cloeon dipterum TaxID=197152 RepID=A0A8S1DWD6_9INSE|nr:Hypothetical predicted protein [Cloeon dipterum]
MNNPFTPPDELFFWPSGDHESLAEGQTPPAPDNGNAAETAQRSSTDVSITERPSSHPIGLKGFCVVCELEDNFIKAHMIYKHQNGHDPIPNPCYEIFMFGDRQIMAPRRTLPEAELIKCEACHGVFYKHRIQHHACGNPKRLIDEVSEVKQEKIRCQKEIQDLFAHPEMERKYELRGGANCLGFCLICELLISSITDHMDDTHLNDLCGILWHCYELKWFYGILTMTPIGTHQEELSKCETCKGVFYNHRLLNHICGNPTLIIDEGFGPEYCLMCQFKCDDVDFHRRKEHFNDWAYRKEDICGVKTLLPKSEIDHCYKKCLQSREPVHDKRTRATSKFSASPRYIVRFKRPFLF